MVQFKFRALFEYDDGPRSFAAAENGERNAGMILEFNAASMSEANSIVGQFLNTHRGIDSEIDFVKFDNIVTLAE